jgi:hypothetical protein
MPVKQARAGNQRHKKYRYGFFAEVSNIEHAGSPKPVIFFV